MIERHLHNLLPPSTLARQFFELKIENRGKQTIQKQTSISLELHVDMHEFVQNSVEILSDYLKVNIERCLKYASLPVRISRLSWHLSS